MQVFEELDDELQQQFMSYLAERGIDQDLGGYLLRLVHDKEQREYMYWLERVQDFTGKWFLKGLFGIWMNEKVV